MLSQAQNIVEIPNVQELVICFGNFLTFGSTPNSQVFLRAAMRLVFLRTSLHVAQLVPLSVCVTLDSARLLTRPDDSSTSALSQHFTMKLYRVAELC